MWLVEEDWSSPVRRFIKGEGAELDIPGKDGEKTGAKAIKVGGHFPGSLVLLHDKRLLVADTMMPTPAGVGDWGEKGRPKGMNSFAFMWSYPNVRSFLFTSPHFSLLPSPVSHSHFPPPPTPPFPSHITGPPHFPPPHPSQTIANPTPPQMIPLPPPVLASMWRILSRHTFSAVHGGFPGLDIEGEDVKQRVWESMGIQVNAEGRDVDWFADEFRLAAP